MNICDNTFILNVIRVLKIIFNSLKIIIPLILIVLIVVDIFKCIANPEETKKKIEVSIKRLIAAILVLFVPTIVNAMFNLFLSNTTIFTCFKNADKDYINARLLEDKEEKRKEEEEKQKQYEEQVKEIEERQKEEREREEEKQKEIITSEKSLGLESSFKYYSDSNYKSLSGYYLYIPENATENMPLIVAFPPNNIMSKKTKSYFEIKDLKKIKAFIYIPVIPNGGERVNWSTRHCRSAVEKINELVDTYKINKKKISLTASSSSGWYIYWTANTYRIFSAIVPISSGMNIDTIKTYDDWEYLKTLAMKGYGEDGGKYAGGHSCEQYGYVTWSAKKTMSGVFEGLGKASDFIYVPDTCHGEMGNYVFGLDENKNDISDIIEWMISQ